MWLSTGSLHIHACAVFLLLPLLVFIARARYHSSPCYPHPSEV